MFQEVSFTSRRISENALRGSPLLPHYLDWLLYFSTGECAVQKALDPDPRRKLTRLLAVRFGISLGAV